MGGRVSAVLQISYFGRSAVAPLGIQRFFDKFCEVFFDRVRVDLHAKFVGGRFLLIDIFVHVSLGHVPPYKAKLLFYVSEPSPRDCQMPGIA